MEQAPRETTPPPLQAPTAKEKKYDRQLRLWAASGQRALEDSHVLLVVGDQQGSNSSVAGVETLKNLILPSIGNFTIADSAVVSNADLGVNFFLESSSLAKSRAEETTKFLQELNPDVTGHSISQQLSEWLPVEGSLLPYNLIIICAPVPVQWLERFTNYASASSIPLIYVHCAGFQSYFAIQLPAAFPVVDTHPDPETTQDLRLLAPWPDLSAAIDALGDIDTLSDQDHGHIPYVFLLLYYLKIWRSEHESRNPENFKEKTAFREFVSNHARTNNAEGGEENFDEACAAVLKSISPPNIGSGCRDMFEMTECTSPSPLSANFWLIAHAIREFHAQHHVLPLPGSVPDMKATSSDYVKLQNIYKAKARSDAAEVTTIVRNLEQKLGRATPIADAEIDQFCKNAAHVRVLTNASNVPVPTLRLSRSDPKTLNSLTEVLQNWDTISSVFVAMNINHVPASTLEALLTEDVDEEGRLEKAVAEFKRYQGAELHNTASVTGGMVAQEAIKLLTRQYVPVDGVCIWDGVRSKTEVIKI